MTLPDPPAAAAPPSVDEQARAYTASCLKKLNELLEAGTDKAADQRLQFWVARYLLELAYGRNPARKPGDADAGQLTDDEREKLTLFVKTNERTKRQRNAERSAEDQGAGFVAADLSQCVGGTSPPEPANTNR